MAERRPKKGQWPILPTPGGGGRSGQVRRPRAEELLTCYPWRRSHPASPQGVQVHAHCVNTNIPAAATWGLTSRGRRSLALDSGVPPPQASRHPEGPLPLSQPGQPSAQSGWNRALGGLPSSGPSPMLGSGGERVLLNLMTCLPQ